jgi:hypothetical protein
MVLDKYSRACERILPLEAFCGQIMFILRFGQDPGRSAPGELHCPSEAAKSRLP